MAVVGDIGLDLTPEGRAAMERLNELADVTIEVGYQADQEAADDETSLAEVAYWNHYGTLHKDGSVMIPARPFMDTIKKHSDELSEFSQQALSSLETADEVANAPISIGVEKAKKVRFGSVYDGLYVTDEQKRVKADLDAITRTTQSPKECLECPVSAGCGWCSGMNYEVFGTANKRTTSICWAHKARVLASAYYYNHRYIEIGDCLPIKAELPELDALSILPSWEYDEFLEIEKRALAKFAKTVGVH